MCGKGEMTPEEHLDDFEIPCFLELVWESGENVYLPTLAELKVACRSPGFWENPGRDINNSAEILEMDKDVADFYGIINEAICFQRPFLLDNGYFGITGSQDVAPGDTVRILPGGRALFTFRKIDKGTAADQQVLIGDTYISGAMNDEACEYIKQTGRQWEEICVV